MGFAVPIFGKSYNITKGYGNGILDFNEECDDGNEVSNDGCSSTGKLEQGFNCCRYASIDICKPLINSIPHNFQQNFLYNIVDPKYGNDNDGWSYCSRYNYNCYVE